MYNVLIYTNSVHWPDYTWKMHQHLRNGDVIKSLKDNKTLSLLMTLNLTGIIYIHEPQ